ncbi:MAG: cell division protein SepF [Clostridia bacterium]|nr:cell division protein SepF [Clostridia bacterium]
MKKAFGLDSEYFDIDDENEDEDGGYETERSPLRRQSANDKIDRRTAASLTRTPTKVVDIHTTAKLQVVLKKPEHFDEATTIADELLEKRTVVLNLEATAKDEAGKLLCFLSGVAYANGGKLKKIANSTYIITPYNVDVMGDLLDELENNGMFFV